MTADHSSVSVPGNRQDADSQDRGLPQSDETGSGVGQGGSGGSEGLEAIRAVVAEWFGAAIEGREPGDYDGIEGDLRAALAVGGERGDCHCGDPACDGTGQIKPGYVCRWFE